MISSEEHITFPLRPEHLTLSSSSLISSQSLRVESEKEECKHLYTGLLHHLQELGVVFTEDVSPGTSYDCDFLEQSNAEKTHLATSSESTGSSFKTIATPLKTSRQNVRPNSQAKALTSWRKWQNLWRNLELRLGANRMISKSPREKFLTDQTYVSNYRKKLETGDIYRLSLAPHEKFADSHWEMSLRNNNEKAVSIGNIFSGLYCNIKEPGIESMEIIKKNELVRRIDAGKKIEQQTLDVGNNRLSDARKTFKRLRHNNWMFISDDDASQLCVIGQRMGSNPSFSSDPERSILEPFELFVEGYNGPFTHRDATDEQPKSQFRILLKKLIDRSTGAESSSEVRMKIRNTGDRSFLYDFSSTESKMKDFIIVSSENERLGPDSERMITFQLNLEKLYEEGVVKAAMFSRMHLMITPISRSFEPSFGRTQIVCFTLSAILSENGHQILFKPSLHYDFIEREAQSERYRFAQTIVVRDLEESLFVINWNQWLVEIFSDNERMLLEQCHEITIDHFDYQNFIKTIMTLFLISAAIKRNSASLSPSLSICINHNDSPNVSNRDIIEDLLSNVTEFLYSFNVSGVHQRITAFTSRIPKSGINETLNELKYSRYCNEENVFSEIVSSLTSSCEFLDLNKILFHLQERFSLQLLQIQQMSSFRTCEDSDVKHLKTVINYWIEDIQNAFEEESRKNNGKKPPADITLSSKILSSISSNVLNKIKQFDVTIQTKRVGRVEKTINGNPLTRLMHQVDISLKENESQIFAKFEAAGKLVVNIDEQTMFKILADFRNHEIERYSQIFVHNLLSHILNSELETIDAEVAKEEKMTLISLLEKIQSDFPGVSCRLWCVRDSSSEEFSETDDTIRSALEHFINVFKLENSHAASESSTENELRVVSNLSDLASLSNEELQKIILTPHVTQNVLSIKNLISLETKLLVVINVVDILSNASIVEELKFWLNVGNVGRVVILLPEEFLANWENEELSERHLVDDFCRSKLLGSRLMFNKTIELFHSFNNRSVVESFKPLEDVKKHCFSAGAEISVEKDLEKLLGSESIEDFSRLHFSSKCKELSKNLIEIFTERGALQPESRDLAYFTESLESKSLENQTNVFKDRYQFAVAESQ